MTEIQLSDEDRAFIEREIRGGEYRTAEEVVSAGLQALRAEEEALRREIQKGLDDIEAGRFVTFDTAEDLKSHILALAKERRNARTPLDPLPTGADRPRDRL